MALAGGALGGGLVGHELDKEEEEREALARRQADKWRRYDDEERSRYDEDY